jgi:2OG-Fe(II) oxygenase superfamily
MNSRSALDAAASLQTYLSPHVLADDAVRRIATGIAAGKLVLLRNALREPFAERMFQCLDTFVDWKLHETYSQSPRGREHRDPFQYHHHNIYDESVYPPDLKWCQDIFSSEETTRLIGQLSGQDCSGSTSFSASWYQPGDHSLPHNDRVISDKPNEVRTVAFVWHLSKDWRPEWGGALYWCPTLRYVPPSFNTLALFVVTRVSTHFVTQVSPYARTKRLAINGWWAGKDALLESAAVDTTAVESSADIEFV